MALIRNKNMTNSILQKNTKTTKIRFYDYQSIPNSHGESTSNTILSETRIQHNYSIFKSFRNATRGLIEVIKTEPNASFQFLIFCFSSLIFMIKVDYWLAVNLVFFVIILAFETMNSAIERVCDFVEPEINNKIGRIKDIAAASVLLASIGWGIVIITKVVLLVLTLWHV